MYISHHNNYMLSLLIHDTSQYQKLITNECDEDGEYTELTSWGRGRGIRLTNRLVKEYVILRTDSYVKSSSPHPSGLTKPQPPATKQPPSARKPIPRTRIMKSLPLPTPTPTYTVYFIRSRPL